MEVFIPFHSEIISLVPHIIFESYINKIQQEVTVCRYLFTAKHSTCFGCVSHPLSGVHKTVTAASDTGHNVRATTFRLCGLIRPRRRKVVVLLL